MCFKSVIPKDSGIKIFDLLDKIYSRWKNGPDVFKLFTNIAIALPNLNQIEQNKHYFEEKTFFYF